jgi:alpha-D-xyloside xylohydrolase
VREVHGFTSVPLLARQGSVIPVGERDDMPDYAYAEGVTLHVYPFVDGDRVIVSVPTVKGETAASFEVRRGGKKLSVGKSGGAGRWSALFVGIRSAASCVGGTASSTAHGILVAAAEGSNAVEVSLE